MEGKGSLFKNKPRFSIVLLVAFIALFIAAGIYIVYRMLAAETFDLATADVYKSASGKVINRISSTNRYSTAAAVSSLRKPTGGSGGTVILVDGTNWPDAAVASSLSGAYDAPILLTPPTSLARESLTEMQRIRPTKIYIIGGTFSVSSGIENLLKTTYFPTANITRISGFDRYETATKVAAEVKAKTLADGKAWEGKAFVVSGASYPDGLTVGTVAANRKWPILYSDSTLNTYTKNAITNLAITKTYVVGGTAAVSDATFKSLPSATRVAAGSNRYDTAIKFANWAKTNVTGFSNNTVGIANGLDFPDALVSSAYLGTLSNPSVLLLSAPAGTTATYNYVSSIKSSLYTIDVFGGTSSINDSVLMKLAPYIGVAINSQLVQAQTLLEQKISQYSYLDGATVEFGDARGYQAITYYQSKRIIISPSHSATLERIMNHEIWHIIDWWHNGRIDWSENVPPSNSADFLK